LFFLTLLLFVFSCGGTRNVLRRFPFSFFPFLPLAPAAVRVLVTARRVAAWWFFVWSFFRAGRPSCLLASYMKGTSGACSARIVFPPPFDPLGVRLEPALGPLASAFFFFFFLPGSGSLATALPRSLRNPLHRGKPFFFCASRPFFLPFPPLTTFFFFSWTFYFLGSLRCFRSVMDGTLATVPPFPSLGVIYIQGKDHPTLLPPPSPFPP